jgi:hypothetical protein
MPDLMETPSDVILTPHGLLLVENAPPPVFAWRMICWTGLVHAKS